MTTKTTSRTASTTQETKLQRRYDIDWLRVVAVVGLLIPYHTYLVFNIYDDWFVKNVHLSTALDPFQFLGDAVGMQLLFLLAGSATWFALRRRNGRQYAGERIKRLLIPLIFGIIIIVPPQSYLGLLHHTDYAGSFLEWYPSFFTSYGDLAGYSMGGFTPAHLWFILYLLIIALAALPLFLFLKGESGQRVVGSLAAFCSWPGVIILMVIPIIAAERLINFYPNPLYFLIYFIYGYLILADNRFEEAIDRHKGIALILGLLALALFVLWADFGLGARFGIPIPLATTFRRGIISWLLIVAVLGYGKKYLNSPPKRRGSRMFLGYFGEGSYPFYILHQTVIVVIAFLVVQWAAGVTAKYLVIVAAAYLGTIVLYDLLVRRTNVTRFLFGMRPLKRKSPAEPAPRPGKSIA
jgi:peptidoglycan/LPS O-acetylase OafA/YrhL